MQNLHFQGVVSFYLTSNAVKFQLNCWVLHFGRFFDADVVRVFTAVRASTELIRTDAFAAADTAVRTASIEFTRASPVRV